MAGFLVEVVHLIVLLICLVVGIFVADAAMVLVAVRMMASGPQSARISTPSSTVQFDLPVSTGIIDWIRRKAGWFLLATWLRKLEPKARGRAVEAYVVISTVILGVMFWWSSTSWAPHGILALLVASFVLYRLAEMLMAGIELVGGELSLNGRTAASVSVIYLIQTLLCFTVLAQHFGVFQDDRGDGPDGPAGYLFMIWGYVSTGGSSFAPKGLLSTAIAMSAGAYSLMLLGVFLAYAVSNLRNPLDKGHQLEEQPLS